MAKLRRAPHGKASTLACDTYDEAVEDFGEDGVMLEDVFALHHPVARSSGSLRPLVTGFARRSTT